MPGTVYVFNCYNEPITKFDVSGSIAGDVAGWSAVAATKYTPSELAVKRSKFPDASTAVFAIGANDVRVPWDSFIGKATVVIPDPKAAPVSLDDDLILFVTRNEIVLLTVRGFVLTTFPIVLQNALGEKIKNEIE